MSKIYKFFSREVWYLDIPLTIIGAALYAIGFSVFISPNTLSPGGFSGIAAILNHFIPMITTGTFVIALNIPLLILGFRRFGAKFILRTAVATVSSSLMLDFITSTGFSYTGDRLLSAIAGGALLGAGIALILMRGGSTGGTDVAVKLINHRASNISFGKLFFFSDAVIITATALIYKNFETALYSAVTVLVSSFVIDKLCYGTTGGKLVYIITKNKDTMLYRILANVDRGVTLISVRGGYTGDSKYMLLCAVRRSEMPELHRIVKKADPEAFIIVTDSNEIHGEGFN